MAAALRWALDSLPDDLDPDQQAAKASAEAMLSGIPATPDELAASKRAAKRDGGHGLIVVGVETCYVQE